ncbi:MAG: hypothetical protein AAFQ35_09760, partial [Pseudomonadota bacterium]
TRKITRDARNVAVAPQAEPSVRPTEIARAPQLRISSVQDLDRGRTVWAPIVSEENYRTGLASKSSTSIRNYLVVDLATGERRRILERDTAVILTAQAVRSRTASRRNVPLALVFSVVEQDTNGDGRLSARDAATVVMAQPDGATPRTLDATGELLAVRRAPDGEVAIFLRCANGDLELIHVETEGFAIRQRDIVWRAKPAGSRAFLQTPRDGARQVLR